MGGRTGRPFGIAMGLLALIALSSTVVAASSSAQGPARSHRRQTVIPAGKVAFFELAGSNGFEIGVSTVGSRHVLLEARSRRGRYVTYLAPAKVSAGGIEAKLGGLGEIRMRFRPSGPPRRTTEPQGHCRGPKALDQKGAFIGRFSFRGERGFTAVTADRVPGLRIESFREVCAGGGRNGFQETGPERPDLTARGTEGGRQISIEIFLREFELSTWADVREERAGMVIERAIGLAGERDRYAEGSDGSAVISPPPPFTGTVDYRPVTSGAGPWTGTLAAPFPGLGVVRLAGSGFSVSR